MNPPSLRRSLVDDVRSGRCLRTATHSNLRAWPEIVALGTTVQDREWHAEGDVLTHTDMVLAECSSVVGALSTAVACESVRLAALFHDIAKPETTRFDEELGHVIAPRHERIGGVRTRYLLAGMGLPHPMRRQISMLVATHHLVKRSVKHFDKPDGPRGIDLLAERVDTQLLWALEVADMQGRTAIDKPAQIEIVQIFRMLCEERNVFGTAPTRWINEEELSATRIPSTVTRRWLAAETHRRRLLGEMVDEHQARAFCFEHASHAPAQIVITVGISGSGKSTAIRELVRDGYEIISADAVREGRFGSADVQDDPGPVHQACREQLRDVLRRGGRAVYDATSVVPDLRRRISGLCFDYNAHVTLWVFDTPLEVARVRNRERERTVPDAVIAHQAEVFEWPTPDEYHALRVIEPEEQIRGA